MTESPIDQWLPWIADSPLFIDTQQIEALYDAVVRPEVQTEEVQLNVSKSSELQKGFEGGASASLGLGGFLSKVFPSLTIEGAASVTKTKGAESGLSLTLRAVDNPYRQLLHLLLHYAVNNPDRLTVTADSPGEWTDAAHTALAPRGIVVLDVQPGAILLPTAAEAMDGSVMLVYPRGEGSPRYPTGADTIEELATLRREYWETIMKSFSPKDAMVAVEDAPRGAGSRFEWVDYRLALYSDGVPADTAHLHLAGRGEFGTGTYAYNMVKRGAKHGLRIVGTLKSDPDINVLAVFER